MSKGPIDPNALSALNQMKNEIANEIGVAGTFARTKQHLEESGENVFIGGRVGGHMTRKLVEMAEKQLINKNP